MGLSRQTLVTLWLALTLGVAVAGWNVLHPDDCARYGRGDRWVTPSQAVPVGRESVAVPCSVWLPRQRPGVQAAVVLDVILAVVCCLSFWADAQRARA